MKTNRELLELAAKAAGMRHIDYTNTDYDGRYGLVTCNEHGYHGQEFDPLNNDGDAMRLAVKLQIVAGKYDDYASAGVIGSCVEFVVWSHEEPDACAATRRAITRAAAAIGEAMQ